MLQITSSIDILADVASDIPILYAGNSNSEYNLFPISNPQLLLTSFGNGIRDIIEKSIEKQQNSDVYNIKSFELHKGIFNFIKLEACGEDFREDIEFQKLFFQYIVKMDSDIISYALNRIDNNNPQNLTLDLSLDIGASVLGLKKINADTGWPLRLKRGLAANGKKLTSSVTNTKRISFQIAFLILYIIRMYQFIPDSIVSILYTNIDAFLNIYYEFIFFIGSSNTVISDPSSNSRLKPRAKVECFTDSEKSTELFQLIGFANIFRIIKVENLDSKLYKDFILDFVTRMVEGNTSCIVRHWTGSGQTAATERRELLYRIECSKPKRALQGFRRVNDYDSNNGLNEIESSLPNFASNNLTTHSSNHIVTVSTKRKVEEISNICNNSDNNNNNLPNKVSKEKNSLIIETFLQNIQLMDSFLLDHDFNFEI